MANRTYHKRGELIDGYRPRGHPNYVIWSKMKSRCTDPSVPVFENYGGRGITYAAEWEHFANFCRDMGVRPSKQYTLDRIDNDRGYFPDNCRWATRTQQCLNRRRFANNKSGYTGVVKKGDRYVARCDVGGRRYMLAGSFDSPEAASLAREQVLSRVVRGESVDAVLERKARYDSSTGERGITRHRDGGFVVRCTHAGVREYVGFFATLEAAKAARNQWIESASS